MKSPKGALCKSPEILLLAITLCYWLISRTAINPIAIGFTFALVFQLIKKNNYLGLVIGIGFMIVSCFMLLPLISGFTEFDGKASDSYKLLFNGISLIVLSIISSLLMISKYVKGE